ncbi:MAG: phenylacetate--CoA ligase family protein [Limisphaerales bacterium]
MTGASPTSRAVLEAEQIARLRALLAAVTATNPFQKAKLAGTGLGADVASLAEFTARCPFTTKPELVADQAAHPPYGSNLTFPIERYSRCHGTSGTSGRPLRWLDTRKDWGRLLDQWGRVYAAAGVTAADRVYFAFSFGPFLGFWTAFEAAQRLGCLCLPGGGMTSAARLGAILDQRVTVLCGTPTYLLHLAEIASEEGISLAASAVRHLIVAGEPGGSVPATRAALEAAWPGARVHDHHGMTETGPVSCECPARPGVLHVIEAAYFAEVVAPDTGRPVPPGAAGELVLTTLTRPGSPLLRYRTGDLVRAEVPVPACACGSAELALVGGILGRVDDMVVVRGVNVYPSAVDALVRARPEVAEYRATVTRDGALAELLVEIEPAPGADGAALAAVLAGDFQTALALRVPVRAVTTGSLPRFEHKARRWVRAG